MTCGGAQPVGETLAKAISSHPRSQEGSGDPHTCNTLTSKPFSHPLEFLMGTCIIDNPDT